MFVFREEHEKKVEMYNKLELVRSDVENWIDQVKEDRKDDFANKVTWNMYVIEF